MNSPTIAPSTKTFHLPKGRVQPILGALGELQKRTDLSGKFARKLARIRRKLSSVEGDVVAEANVIQDRFTKRDAGDRPLPVFQRNALGQVVFEKDGDGKDTDVPQVEPGRVHLTDVAGYQKEMAEFEGERITFDCETLSESEFDSFKAVRGDVIDALMDLAEDSEFTSGPEASAAAVPTGVEDRSAP
jgi:hypothetical protein